MEKDGRALESEYLNCVGENDKLIAGKWAEILPPIIDQDT